jgi:hypothetical protein
MLFISPAFNDLKEKVTQSIEIKIDKKGRIFRFPNINRPIHKQLTRINKRLKNRIWRKME